MAIKGISDVRS